MAPLTRTGGAGARDGLVDDGDGEVRTEKELPGDGQPDYSGSDDDDVEAPRGRASRVRIPTRMGPGLEGQRAMFAGDSGAEEA